MKSIGKYEIRDQLGEGAMARVNRAFDPQIQRDVALKEAEGLRTDLEDINEDMLAMEEEDQQQIKDLCLRLAIPRSSITSSEPLMSQISGGKNDA